MRIEGGLHDHDEVDIAVRVACAESEGAFKVGADHVVAEHIRSVIGDLLNTLSSPG